MTTKTEALIARLEGEIAALQVLHDHGITRPIDLDIQDLRDIVALAKQSPATGSAPSSETRTPISPGGAVAGAGGTEWPSEEMVEKAGRALHARTLTSAFSLPWEYLHPASRGEFCDQGRTVLVAAGPPPEPRGCPMPGACSCAGIAITEDPGLGWKLSDAARDKIVEITGTIVHAAGALHGVVMASLDAPPAPPEPPPISDETLEACRTAYEKTMYGPAQNTGKPIWMRAWRAALTEFQRRGGR